MDFPDVFAERLETYTSLIFRKDKIYTHPKVVATAQNEHDLLDILFQHTAAQRWLPFNRFCLSVAFAVSTHSHPKVAALFAELERSFIVVSTHSRAEAAAYQSPSKSLK